MDHSDRDSDNSNESNYDQGVQKIPYEVRAIDLDKIEEISIESHSSSSQSEDESLSKSKSSESESSDDNDANKNVGEGLQP